MRDSAISFEEWLRRIFDISPDSIGYFYDQDRRLWSEEAAPSVTFEYMTRLFENPLAMLEPFTDEQQKWGLYYIAANSPREEAYRRIDIDYRRRCIHSSYNLFAKFFAVKCWPDPYDMDQ